ncbi:hypothetical protein GGR52DRAFT_577610 [Hypoxylon sp. FL1284]|nr:hypothetical protein GGR52DRAFT_577610 [Hypoxylon sp. FL1284]
MADPLRLVPDVLKLSRRTAKVLMEYSQKVKDAPGEVYGIMLEVKTLSAVLETLQAAFDRIRESSTKAQLSESLKQCQGTLCELERLVAPEEDIFESEPADPTTTRAGKYYSSSLTAIRRQSSQLVPAQVTSEMSRSAYDLGRRTASPYKSIMSTSKRLKWPLVHQTKAKELLERLKRHKSQLSLAVEVGNVMTLNTISTTVKDIETTLNDNEKRRILAWLKPKFDMREFQLEQHDKQEDETCDWITNSTGWKQWLEGGSLNPDGYRRFIWIYGIPGAGKTDLASFLIDEIAKYCRATGYSYYYCLHERNQEETIPLLRWIIGDLCRQARRFIPKELDDLYETGTFTIQGLVSCFLAFCRRFQKEGRRVYLVVDAVDESIKPRKRMLDLLIKIGTDPSFENVSLLMTSREEEDIKQAMDDLGSPLPINLNRSFEEDAEEIVPYTPITMSNHQVMRAIETYVKRQFARSSKFRLWNTRFREQVESELARNARGMFRWVACQIDIIERLYLDQERVREALSDMPDTLFGTYAKVLENIAVEQRPFAYTALALICSSTNSTKSADVLVQASLHNVQHGAIQKYDVKALREILGCLIKTNDLRKRPERLLARVDESMPLQKVSVAHYTVREFLFAHSKKAGEPRPAGDFTLSDSGIRTLEMQVVFNGLQRWGMNRLPGQKGVTRYEEHCLEMSDAALREGRRNLLVKDESVWKSVVPCLSPRSAHVRELSNQRIRKMFLKWRRLFAFDDLTAEADPNSRIRRTQRATEFARKYLQDPEFDNLSPKMKAVIWSDRFTIDSAIDDNIPCLLNKKNPMTLLRLCVVWKQVEFLEIFLDAGANFINEPSIIHKALREPYFPEGNEDGSVTGRVLKILLEAGADPNPPGFLYTPLQYTVLLLEESWVQSLLLEGRDANSIGDPTGRHPWGGEGEDWHSQNPLDICDTTNPWKEDEDGELERVRRQLLP